MKPVYEGKHILWMVWTLAAVGVMGGIVTIVLIGWNTSTIRSERARLAEYERQWTQLSEEVRKLAVGGEGEVRDLLEGDSTNEPMRKSVDALRELISRYRESDKGHTIPSHPLVALENYVSDLEQMWTRAYAWKKETQRVEDDVLNLRTLGEARALVHDLKTAVKNIEGQRRLNDAIELRRWQSAKDEEASQLAKSFLTNKITEQGKPVLDLTGEIAELSKLIEMLVGEDQFDLLVDLKDNKLKPTLDKLTRSLVALAETGDIPEDLASGGLDKLKQVLFGEGFRIDKAHQTIQIGEGGLYALRGDELRLRQERRKWERELQQLSKRIEIAYDELEEVIQERTKALAEQVEQNLTSSWNHLAILISLAFVGFLGLAFVISRGIRRQVGAIEKARADADANHQKAESLLVEQQQAAEAFKNLSRHNELILNSAGEGIFGLDAEGHTSFINLAGADMVGWNVEELVGKSQHATLHHTRADGTPCRTDTCPIFAAMKNDRSPRGRKRDIVEKGWNTVSH